jgi:AAA+ ATPase superfamily predicted ATPase
VQRVVPIHQIHQPHSRQALYLLADHYVAFWYRFVDRLRHLIALHRLDEALQAIQQDFDRYVSGQAFEDVCRQYLWRARAVDHLPDGLSFETVGSWWTLRADLQDQIDVVAMQGGRAILVGECKWSRQPVDARDLESLGVALRKAAADLNPVDRPWRSLFSRTGFSEDLQELAKDSGERLLLVAPDTLYI